MTTYHLYAEPLVTSLIEELEEVVDHWSDLPNCMHREDPDFEPASAEFQERHDLLEDAITVAEGITWYPTLQQLLDEELGI